MPGGARGTLTINNGKVGETAHEGPSGIEGRMMMLLTGKKRRSQERGAQGWIGSKKGARFMCRSGCRKKGRIKKVSLFKQTVRMGSTSEITQNEKKRTGRGTKKDAYFNWSSLQMKGGERTSACNGTRNGVRECTGRAMSWLISVRCEGARGKAKKEAESEGLSLAKTGGHGRR